MNKKKKSESFDSRHLTHCVEKERKYFSAFLSGFKTSYLVRSHEHCRNGAKRHVLNMNFKAQDLWKQKDNVLLIDPAWIKSFKVNQHLAINC